MLFAHKPSQTELLDMNARQPINGQSKNKPPLLAAALCLARWKNSLLITKHQFTSDLQTSTGTKPRHETSETSTKQLSRSKPLPRRAGQTAIVNRVGSELAVGLAQTHES